MTVLPSYLFAMEKLNKVPTGGELTFVDFLPQCIKPAGIFKKPRFEPFRTLVERGNEWLFKNPQYEARTCESVEFKFQYKQTDTEKMTYLEFGEASTCYTRGLRLWLVPRNTTANTSQQFGYINLGPEKVKEGRFLGAPTYETLDAVINRFNNWIRTNPITGRIINIESQEMKSNNQYELDPELSYWYEIGDYQKQFVFILRIFFEVTQAVIEEIGVMDFFPEKISESGIFSLPKYRPFSETVQSASNWCRQQSSHLRICNVQSLEIKVKKGTELDAQKMTYCENGSFATFYIRIIRVSYTKPLYSSGENPHLKPVHQLTCKSFVPIQLTKRGFSLPDFENLTETKMRVESWIRATGADVISAETSAMRLYTGGEARHGTETSFTYNTSERSEYWIFIIRLYLNGYYHEPPKEMLPPIPEIEEKGCCIIL